MFSEQVLPDISMADFDNVEDIVACAMHILSHANSADMFVPALSAESAENQSLIRIARMWLEAVSRCISALSAGDALEILASFDAIHHLVFHAPADKAFVTTCVLNAFNAFMEGDRSVDEYRLFRAVNAEIDRCNASFLGEPMDWTCRKLEEWWRNFRSVGSQSSTKNPNASELQALSDYDTIQQASILLDQDLWAFEPDQARFKTLLAKKLHHSLRNGNEMFQKVLLT